MLESRDNPPAPEDGRRKTRPFDYQLKIYNQSHPDILRFIQRVRELCDQYGAVFTVAEVGGDLAETEMKAFTAGEDQGLHRRLRNGLGRRPRTRARRPRRQGAVAPGRPRSTAEI